MTEARSINHMKCYLFRMAQEKWKLSAFDTVKLFNGKSNCLNILMTAMICFICHLISLLCMIWRQF